MNTHNSEMETENNWKEIGLRKLRKPALDVSLLWTFQPSLEHFASVVFAIDLWKSPDIRIELTKYVTFYKSFTMDDRKHYSTKLLKKIHSKLFGLELIETLQDQMLNVLKPIGHEIVKNYFKIFHQLLPNFDIYIDRICWTPWGMLDKQKTMESFLLDENYNIGDRYFTACRFCCGEYDANVWNQFTKEMKDFVKTKAELKMVNFVFKGTCRSRKSDLIVLGSILDERGNEHFCPCLTHDVLLNKTDGRTFNQFWLNSSSGRRKDILEMVAGLCISEPICNSDVVVFLVSQMNSKQRMVFYQSNADFILSRVLNDWTKRRVFMTSVKQLGNYISFGYSKCVLRKIAKRTVEDLGHIADSRRWFESLWNWSPDELKRLVFGDHPPCIMGYFVTAMDAQSIKLMLSDATADERREAANWVEEKMLSFASMKQWISFRSLIGQVWLGEN